MLHKYHSNYTFFIEHAPAVRWNDIRKCFNLNSGKHRAAFLAGMGCNYIPVRSSPKDYEKYLGLIDKERVYLSLQTKYEEGYYPPVENPFFYDFSRYGENAWYSLIRIITRVYYRWYYHDDNSCLETHKTIYINLSNNDLMSLFFNRMGCNVDINVSMKNKSYDLVITDKKAVFDDAMNRGIEHIFYVASECNNEWAIPLAKLFWKGKEISVYVKKEDVNVIL